MYFNIYRLLHTILFTLLVFILSSCAGYKLGNTKLKHLEHIEKIHIPLLKDNTQEIKLAPQATNELVKAVSNDGTYSIARAENADATLIGTIHQIKFSEFRSNRLDTLRAEELSLSISVAWQLLDPSGNVLAKGSSSGATRFFAADNQRLARDNAKANALENVAQKITSRIANGF